LIEAVFLPYKASMWDSLESIWIAANADPDCNAYVIPIPYYDKNPDGSFGEMHCEKELYPYYVPVVDWQTYDIEERRPDVIFIHNPYDNGNNATSVHPDYYSKRLKDFTKLIVYSPYFICNDNISEDFCINAAMLYADKIIVQSERIRRECIHIFQEFEVRHNCKGKLGRAEEKFVALGSPKLDAILNIKREDYVLPDVWYRLIKDKKVILYNTSIGAILQGKMRYLKKLRMVLDYFKERKDVVLWWRPHPLSETTIGSMRPFMLDEYKRIVSEYKQEAFGIYDDTADLHRAIAYSDGYFGDYSSLVALYRVTGKPVLLQNIEMNRTDDSELREEILHSDIILFGNKLLTVNELEREYPQFYAYKRKHPAKQQTEYATVINYEYGISAHLNAIYKTDEQNGKAEFWMSFPGEENVPWLYHPPIKINNKLLFAPARARKWAVYDLDSEEWNFKDVPKKLSPSAELRGAFGGGFVCGSYIIFRPGESGAFAKYNIKNENITYHRNWYKNLESYIDNVDYGILSGVLYYGDNLLLTTVHAGIVIEINPRKMRIVKTYKICEYGFRAACLIPNTDTVYLLKYRKPPKEPDKGQWVETIVKWNILTGEIHEFTNLPVALFDGSTQNALSRFIFWKDVLYIIPLQGDSILKLDHKTDEVTGVALTPKFDFFKRKSDHYAWAKDIAMPYIGLNAEHMTFITQLPYDYALADVNFETGTVTNRRKWLVKGAEKLCIPRELYKGSPIKEDFMFTINEMIDWYVNKSKTQPPLETDIAANIGTAGTEIFSYSRSLLGCPLKKQK